MDYNYYPYAPPPSQDNTTTYIIIFVIICVSIVIGIALYFYMQKDKKDDTKTTDNQSTSKADQQLSDTGIKYIDKIEDITKISNVDETALVTLYDKLKMKSELDVLDNFGPNDDNSRLILAYKISKLTPIEKYLIARLLISKYDAIKERILNKQISADFVPNIWNDIVNTLWVIPYLEDNLTIDSKRIDLVKIIEPIMSFFQQYQIKAINTDAMNLKPQVCEICQPCNCPAPIQAACPPCAPVQSSTGATGASSGTTGASSGTTGASSGTTGA